jgi:hypothetical protein
MLEIKLLTTLLVKLENGLEKIAHFDPETKKVYCDSDLTNEEIFQIRNIFAESFIPTEIEDPVETLDFSHFEDMTDYYINQGELYDNREEQYQSESDSDE